MKRKIIGIVVAVVLATIGTLALVSYVQNAKDEAVKEEAQVSVLVVTDTIRQGATFSEISSAVKATEIPERLLAADAVTDLDDVDAELVAGIELQAGEQLLESRLVDAKSLVRVEVPKGLQELTLALDPVRAGGADLEAGDIVGVVLSFEPFDLTSDGLPASSDDPVDTPINVQPQQTAKTPNTTHLALNNVLVTSVKYSQADSERVSEVQTASADGSNDNSSNDPVLAATIDEAPGNELLITLAVTAPEVEQLIFAAEFGLIWLTGQNADTNPGGTRIVTLNQVYVSVPR